MRLPLVAFALTGALLVPSYVAAADLGRESAAGNGPSWDAVELGALAPPANRSTSLQDYGDAAVARSAAQHHIARAARLPAGQDRATAYVPCEPRSAKAYGYACGDRTGRPAPLTYQIAPSFVSSPQVVGQDPGAQSLITPPVTSLFYAWDAIVSGQPLGRQTR
jgi:hypothetical protein